MENIVAIVVVGLCGLVTMGFGIVQYRSKKPVTFWTGSTPPKPEELTDVKAYNKKHGIMWILYGLGMLIAFGIGERIQNIGLMVMDIEIVGGLVAIILYHIYLERKYLIKHQK